MSEESDLSELIRLDGEYENLIRNLSILNNRFFNAVESANSEMNVEMEKNMAEQNRMMKSFLLKLVTTLLILIAAGVIIAIFTTRAIVLPISTLIRNLTAISSGEGDLTRRIKLGSQNEIGQLGKNINSFIAKIHDIIYRMKEVSSESNSIGEKTCRKDYRHRNCNCTNGC